MTEARSILVYGLVQGVGFRPFLHRIAKVHQVAGRVRNRNDCVEIVAEGTPSSLDGFLWALANDAPPLSRITDVESESVAPAGYADFVIEASRSSTNEVTRVAPDTAVCKDCLSDMATQPRRTGYAFTNCTNCGPRFTIIRDLPYDRPKTTMASFAMCAECMHEYEDIENRRYHAQPNACIACGPKYSIYVPDSAGSAETSCPDDRVDATDPIRAAAADIDAGRIVAIKGIGGFHLACNAADEDAVIRLRLGKRREGKPFAVMCRDKSVAEHIAVLSPDEAKLLTSPRAPIVILKRKKSGLIAQSVAHELDTIGIMLPYAPVHHVLFEHLETDVIVMTSGNLSDEPIAITNEDAIARLSPICDAVLHHNRDIHNRVDDSLAAVYNGTQRILRRARGFAPEPVPFDADVEGIAAVGGELKNVFCIGKGREAICSQHIGDLKTPENLEFYEESFDRMTRLFRFSPTLIACDLHPDYLSTLFAQSISTAAGDNSSHDDAKIPVIYVQHHHAHIASVLAENRYTGEVIGVSFDGTGYGADGHIWGGEILVASRLDYRRFAHLDYIPLPGGDRAIYEPWRIAYALAYASFGPDQIPGKLFEEIPAQDLTLISSMIDRGINSPLSSGMGRLFDGVAALCGIAKIRSYEAEGPMRLEAALEPGWENATAYPVKLAAAGDDSCISMESLRPSRSQESSEAACEYRISWTEAIREIAADIISRTPVSVISARFHRGVAESIREACLTARDETKLSTVALSGGVFQNRHLSELSEHLLTEAGFEVLVHREVPSNDGGLSLGQLAVAASRRAAQ